MVAKIGFVSLVDLGRNLEMNAEGLRNLNGAVGPLFRRDASEKCEVSAARGVIRLMMGRPIRHTQRSTFQISMLALSFKPFRFLMASSSLSHMTTPGGPSKWWSLFTEYGR